MATQACATGRFGPDAGTPAADGKRTLKNLSVRERESMLRRAQVWQPLNTPTQSWIAPSRRSTKS